MTRKEFTLLVEQYEKLVYTICFQLTQDHHIAQDLAQETFLSAYSHMDSCTDGNYRPWLTRIAANKAKDFLKSAVRREEATEILPEPAGTDACLSAPEQLLLSADNAEEIRRRIYGLGTPYREPAILFFLEELPPGEISRRLGRPEKTVYTQLSRARQLLKAQLTASPQTVSAKKPPTSERRKEKNL